MAFELAGTFGLSMGRALAAPQMYEVSLEGDLSSALLERLEASSQLLKLQEQPPVSRAALDRRILDDLDRFLRILKSEGYYGATTDYRVEDTEDESLRVTLTIVPGVSYRIAEYAVVYRGADLRTHPPPVLRYGDLQLGPSPDAKAASVKGSEGRLLRLLAERARPLAKIVERDIVVDHAARDMRVRLDVDPGPAVTIGPLELEGFQEVNPDYIRRILRWPRGVPYDRRLVEARRRQLLDMGLFSTVKVEPAESPNADGGLPVTIGVAETTNRTIGLGAGYSTDEGIGGDIFWRLDNLYGQAESLELSLSGTELRQAANAEFAKPNFLVFDQTLRVGTELRVQDDEAFDEKTLIGSVGLERQLTEQWLASFAVQPEFSRIDDNESGEDSYVGIGFPAVVQRDDRDDILDATKGSLLRFSLTPNFGELDGFTTFVIAETNGAVYWTPFAGDRLTFAARGRFGVIFGDSRQDLPANKRYYSGGGGSIRGYEFQTVGPLDASQDPLGGRSVLETGIEARIRIGESFGVVPFLEGGTAYSGQFLDSGEDLRWAAGLGLRYYTAVGPLRFDLAFPLNERRRDEDFEFYVSIGQSF